MKLSRLIKNIKIASLIPPNVDLSQIDINGLTADSRKVTPTSLFVAIRGFSSDGHRYVKEVVQKGVRAIVVEEKQTLPNTKILQIIVQNTREALAFLSCEFFGHPTRELTGVGITGTNGKTTSTYLLEAIFKESGFKPGVIGTVNTHYLNKVLEAPNTTPESLEFQKVLRQMKNEGVTHVVMEVSSHALKLKRVDGSHFDVGLFTNLTQDHLDFHPDMEEYFQSKKRLFFDLIKDSQKKNKYSIINIDDPYGLRLYEELKKATCEGSPHLLSFSLRNPKADFYAKGFQFDLKGLKAKIHTQKGDLSIKSALLGEHNLSNILGVVSVSSALGIAPQYIEAGISKVEHVTGRLERVDAGQSFLVLVDYAHTEDALRNVGKALNQLKKNRIITVFGCGGDRDRKKRPLMAKAASQFSDEVIVTSDNPRMEDPKKIIEEILTGFEKKNYHVEPDRKKAIQKALSMAKEKDIVLIAGKGHEDYQILGKTKIHFDDREIAYEALCLRQKKS